MKSLIIFNVKFTNYFIIVYPLQKELWREKKDFNKEGCEKVSGNDNSGKVLFMRNKDWKNKKNFLWLKVWLICGSFISNEITRLK